MLFKPFVVLGTAFMTRGHLLFLCKLMAPFVVVSVAFSAALVALQYFIGSSMLQQQLQVRIQDELQFLEFEFKEDGLSELIEEIDERLEKNQQSWRFLYAVQAPSGQWIFDELRSAPPLGWSQIRGLEYAESTLLLTTSLSEGYRLTVGLDETDLSNYGRAAWSGALWLLLASTLVFVSIGIFLYRQFMLAVRNVSVPVQSFTDGHFDARIRDLRGGPEFTRLSTNINAMFEQIERLIEQLSGMSANLAHDLRTPLTRVKNSLGTLSSQLQPEGQEQLRKIEHEFDQVLSFFADILQLHEIQRGSLQAHFETVDLSALVQECLDTYQPLLEEQGIKSTLNLQQSVTVQGSRALLKQVLVNLIENTLRHSGAGGELMVDLKTSKQGSSLHWINDVEVPTKPESRYSSHHSFSHNGLGLKFVNAIVELHGGAVEFGSGAGGTYYCTIRLP